MILFSYNENFKKILNFFVSLASPVRLKVFRLLLENDFCVCELQNILKIEQSRLSHQLRLLRLAGLIEMREQGRWSVYSVRAEWKNHPLSNALKKALSLEEAEKAAVAEVFQKSLRLRAGN